MFLFLQKNKNLLFNLIIFLLPTQLVFHFWPNWSFLHGIRIDYFSPSIYLIDIFVILYLVIQIKQVGEKLRSFFLPLLAFLVFILINIFFSTLPVNSLVYWFRVFVYVAFALVSLKSNINFYKDLAKPLSFSLLIIGFLSLLQFSFQKSIGGPFYLLGEREVSVLSLGSPQVSLFGKNYLRAQSTFSHPNSLAGFVLVSLVLVYFTKFPKKDLLLKKATLVLGLISILLSFSQAVFLTLGVVCALVVINLYSRISFRKNLLIIGLLLLVFSLLLPTVSANLIKRGAVYQESIQLRLELAAFTKTLTRDNFLFGVGANNFIYELSKNPPVVKSILFLQPVHNIFLLIISEGGVIGLIFYVTISFLIFIKNTNTQIFKYSLIAIFLTGFFDHYWLSLNQNLFLFIIVLIFGFQTNKKLPVNP